MITSSEELYLARLIILSCSVAISGMWPVWKTVARAAGEK